MNRNMIKWLLCASCVFAIAEQTLGCPPPPASPTVKINGFSTDYEYDATGVKLLFLGSATGTITNYKWHFPSGVTPEANSPAECSSCGTGCLENGPTKPCNRVNCTFSSTGKYTITLTATDNNGHTGSATCNVYIANVVSVEWVKYDSSNVDIDDHPAVPPNGGKMIFPGKKTYDDTGAAMRSKVLAKVTISNTFTDMSGSGFPVNIKLYDVDDPSADDYGLPEAQCMAPLDCDDPTHSAFSSYEDNKGGMEQRFCFTNGWDSDGGYVANGSDNVGIVMLASFLPGNNVRVVASTTQEIINRHDPWDEVTWERVDSDSGAGLPSQVKRSDMLTVRRKLHIERDTMGRPPESGWELNSWTGTASSYLKVSASPLRSRVHLGFPLADAEGPCWWGVKDILYFGRYVVGSSTYIIVGNTCNIFSNDYLTVVGDPGGDGASLDYVFYDDDETAFVGTPLVATVTELLPELLDLGSWKGEFAEAYVDIEYLSPSYSSSVPFVRNLSSNAVYWGIGSWNDSAACTSSESFWVQLAVAGFQPQVGDDKDPDSDTTVVLGASRAGPYNQCVVHLETQREWSGTPVGQALAHEIGHGGGAEDNDCEAGCIMWVNSSGAMGSTFCNKCLNELRKDEEW